MTNLADLIPAGGGQNNTDFVADGNISAGVPVVLTAAGKAAAVAKTPVAAALNDVDTIASGTQYTQDWCYDTVNDKIVVIFSNSAYSSYPYYVIGTVTSQAVSWTTPTSIFSRAVSHISCCYNATEDRIVMCCEDDSLPKAIVGTSDGSSITWGSIVTIMNPSGYTPYWYYNNVVEWSGTSKVVWCGTEFNSTYQGYAAVATLSGSAGSATSTWDTNETTFTASGSSNVPKNTDMCYDYGTGDQVIILYAKSSTNVEVIAGAISGTTLTFGSAVVAKSSAPSNFTNALDYDTGNSKALIVYGTDPTDGNAGTTNSRVISTSGSTITLEGTETAFIGTVSGGTTQYAYSFYRALTYAAHSSNFVFVYESPSPDLDGYVTTVSISGTTITWSNDQTEIVAGEIPDGVNRVAYDPDTDQAVLLYRDGSASNYLKSQVYTIPYEPTNLTATNLLGLAPSAISDTATGTINTWGSRCESSNLLPDGVSAGTAVQYSASNLADKYAADSVYDSTNNKVIVVYDGAGASAGYGIVGTISGTSVSYGSAVQYSGGNARMSQVAYDSTNQRVVVAYSDGANSGYLTAAVGTVSGTSISWGTPVVADSTTNDFYIGIDFDINAGKVLIIWKDNATAYNYSIVGTVSGTSISFGTRAAVNSSFGYQMIGGLTYDANAQKHLFFRDRTSGTIADGYVGTISGTSVSWGSATSATTTENFSNGWGSYDANAQKIVLVYTNDSTTTMGSQVATISGTSVSFGTQVVVDSSINPDFTASYYDSAAQTIVAFGRATNYYGYIGTVSGTSISWTSASTLLLDAAFGYGLGTPAYDANAGKGLILFANTADSAAESAVTTAGTTPLTIGSDYYVQEDGTLSTTSTSPAQLIGNAIKTNQINIKDYTG